MPTDTGGNQIVDGLSAHTGGNQIAEGSQSNTGGSQIIEQDWRDSAYLSENTDEINKKWHGGNRGSSEASLIDHFNKHGKEVKAETPEQYLNKAKAFAGNLRGARVVENIGGYTQGVTRYYKNGKYIDIGPDKRIVSFGKQ
ncbi:hypothetical protein SOASR030_35410 [Leminorella grimontii]|uniref:Uncharacterized protein n=1 Tax=Leminorella grimontii TaxID=82981 RepID=A0AAV5N6Q2_9GAMM|nr:hypothetical protein [Leminorella grimontii]KFC94406.1 hypothetical protein GLGR_2753 [Leminorella grimontii ATCC 33999 = DSM 5078]GKX57429.1 hypothetical protein SOASR030_35410 [Leminorella grimontii]